MNGEKSDRASQERTMSKCNEELPPTLTLFEEFMISDDFWPDMMIGEEGFDSWEGN